MFRSQTFISNQSGTVPRGTSRRGCLFEEIEGLFSDALPRQEMAVIRIDDKSMRGSQRFESIAEQQRLVHRYECILATVQDQRWRSPSRNFAKEVHQFWIGVTVRIDQLSHPNTRCFTIEQVEIIGARVKHRAAHSFHLVKHRRGDYGAAGDPEKHDMAAIHPFELLGHRETVLDDLSGCSLNRTSGNFS